MLGYHCCQALFIADCECHRDGVRQSRQINAAALGFEEAVVAEWGYLSLQVHAVDHPFCDLTG